MRSVFYIIQKFNEIFDIDDDELKIKFITSILLKKENEVPVIKEKIHKEQDIEYNQEYNEDEYNDEDEEELNEDELNEDELNEDELNEDQDDEDHDEEEDKYEYEDEYEDEDKYEYEYEDGSSSKSFTKYETLKDGNCFFSAVFRSLKNSNLLKKFEEKLDENINIDKEKKFIEDIRSLISNKIDLSIFFKHLKDIHNEDKHINVIINKLK